MEILNYNYSAEDFVEEPDYEIIEGVKVLMAPSGTLDHGTVIGNIFGQIFVHIFQNNIKAAVFVDDIDVHLPDGSYFKPDLTITLNPEIVKNRKAIYGVPDMVVEVLSYSTMRNDIGKKKNAYERNGVKEYWIVDPWSKRIEVYHLIDKKFELDEVYKYHTAKEFDELDEEDKKTVKNYIKVSIFEDLTVDIRRIFKWWFDD